MKTFFFQSPCIPYKMVWNVIVFLKTLCVGNSLICCFLSPPPPKILHSVKHSFCLLPSPAPPPWEVLMLLPGAEKWHNKGYGKEGTPNYNLLSFHAFLWRLLRQCRGVWEKALPRHHLSELLHGRKMGFWPCHSVTQFHILDCFLEKKPIFLLGNQQPGRMQWWPKQWI